MKRIRRLLNRPEPRHIAFTPAVAAGIVILVAAAGLTAWQPKPQETPRPAAMASPYQKWVTEDVAYIITDAERAAFRRLATDDEREHFIEQFWLRRDPTPGTPANEFKEEHYRRIAYANEHFASSIPGWKTDLGRIYIVYGPPDEIENHPNGDATHAFPYIQWMYRLIAGIGNNIIVEFDDTNHNGEYHMTADRSVQHDAIFTDTVKRGPMNRQVRVLGVLGDSGTAVVDVPDSVSREIAIGQAASLSLGRGAAPGRVTRIDPSVNGITRVAVQLDTPPAANPGRQVDATIDIEHIPDTVFVGRPVLGAANSDSTIFKIEPDGKHAVRVPVQFGKASVNQIEIVTGLFPGDRVILSDMSAYANYDRIEIK